MYDLDYLRAWLTYLTYWLALYGLLVGGLTWNRMRRES